MISEMGYSAIRTYSRSGSREEAQHRVSRCSLWRRAAKMMIFLLLIIGEIVLLRALLD